MYLNFIEFIIHDQFWSNFMVGLILLIIGSILFPRIISYFTVPKKLDFFFKENGSKQISYTRNTSSDEYEVNFNLVIRNTSGISFKYPIYWHLYVPKNIFVECLDLGIGKIPRCDILETHRHFYGIINNLLYPLSTTEIHYLWSIKSDKSIDLELGYFFSTEFGHYPKSLKEIGNSSGVYNYGSMGKLYIKNK